MKCRKLPAGIPVMAFIFAIVLTGCIFDDGEHEYTVWTGSKSYSEFAEQFAKLDDGYFFHFELEGYEFDQISKSLSNNNKHSWTEKELQKWAVNRGFDSYTAEETISWLIKIYHGIIAVRNGSVVYILVK